MSKRRFKRKSARGWLIAHQFKSMFDEKPNSLRARQIAPELFHKKSFRTINLTKGVKAVIGCRKR
jgi:hypothetical protein